MMDLSKPDMICVYCGTDLEEVKRLRLIAERAGDVEGMAQLLSDTHKYAESIKIFRHSARALSAWLEEGK